MHILSPIGEQRQESSSFAKHSSVIFEQNRLTVEEAQSLIDNSTSKSEAVERISDKNEVVDNISDKSEVKNEEAYEVEADCV